MKIIETERLTIRRGRLEDAAFILRLVNDPAWLEHIGDSGVSSLEQAEAYIRRAMLAMYGDLGFGLYVLELKSSAEPIGICGLIKRVWLQDVDLGFALLADYRSMGYAFEAAAATMVHGKQELALSRLVAITTQGNTSSIELLQRLGFVFEHMLPESASPANGSKAELMLFAVAL